MKNTKTIQIMLVGSLASLTLVGNATAQGFQTIAPVTTAWKGSAEVGGSVTTGNSRSENIYVGGEISRHLARWAHTAYGAYDYGKSSNSSSAMAVARDKGLLGLKSRYKFTPRLYGFGLVQGERDRVGSIKYRATEALGLGYRVIEQPALTLDVEAGPAYRQTRSYTLPRDDEFALYGGAKLDWQVAPGVSLSNHLSSVWADNNTSVNNEAALDVRLSKMMGARFSHNLAYNSDPVITTNEKIDTTTRASLVFGF